MQKPTITKAVDNKEILIKIRQIVRSINLESKKIQKEFGVSIPQVLCLSYLSEQEHFQATHKEITQYLNLNSSTASGIIYRLEKKNYIARLPKGKDKRVTTVILTNKGQELLNNTPDLLQDKISSKLDTLSTEKQQGILEALNTIINLLDISQVDASPLITVEGNINQDAPE